MEEDARGWILDTAKLQRMMARNELDVAGFAKAINTKPELVAKWLRHEALPKVDNIRRIEGVFGWPLIMYLQEI